MKVTVCSRNNSMVPPRVCPIVAPGTTTASGLSHCFATEAGYSGNDHPEYANQYEEGARQVGPIGFPRHLLSRTLFGAIYEHNGSRC